MSAKPSDTAAASVPSNIEIAQRAKLRPIVPLARERLGIPEESLEPYGHYKAKVSLDYIASLHDRPDGKLILVTAISPTPAGEGKTTTTVGLGDALNQLGKRAIVCLREPALGPVFGMKGGAAGGGYSQVVPMEDINLHFTGDFAAIALANNLLAALIDNHIHHGNELRLRRAPHHLAARRGRERPRAARDRRRPGRPRQRHPREDGFDIVVASEVMAILCLATSLKDLKERLGRIVVGYRATAMPILARDLKAHGAMTALLETALAPNLVQTLENNPAFIHGGPFANIAHGCNSVIATRTALQTRRLRRHRGRLRRRPGGGEVRRHQVPQGRPDAERRGDRRHGARAEVPRRRGTGGSGKENLAALEKGVVNLERHIDNVRNNYGLPCVVAINRRSEDTDREIKLLIERMAAEGVRVIAATPLRRRRQGRARGRRARSCGCAEQPNGFHFVYEDSASLWDKMKAIATKIYHAADITADAKVRDQIKQLQERRLRPLPGVRRQDAVLVLDRSEAARRARGPHRQHPRGAPRRRRRVRDHDLRRHHDHARTAEGAGRQLHRRGRQRPHHRPVLKPRAAAVRGHPGTHGQSSGIRPESSPHGRHNPHSATYPRARRRRHPREVPRRTAAPCCEFVSGPDMTPVLMVRELRRLAAAARL